MMREDTENVNYHNICSSSRNRRPAPKKVVESAEIIMQSMQKSPKANMTFEEKIVNSAMKAGLKYVAAKRKVEEVKDTIAHIRVDTRPVRSGELV
jgi:hypothetical protein